LAPIARHQVSKLEVFDASIWRPPDHDQSADYASRPGYHVGLWAYHTGVRIGRLRTSLVLAQNRDNLFFREPDPLHQSWSRLSEQIFRVVKWSLYQG
jgi:hypothetical protein